MTGLLVEARDSNPRRLSAPMNRPKYSGTTDWTTGKTTRLKRSSPLWVKGAMERHNKAMDAVEALRATRAEKKAFRDHLLDVLRQAGGEITEGDESGENFEATFERLGRRRGHELKRKKAGLPPAKPGEPGYLRKIHPSNLNPAFEQSAQAKRKIGLQKKIKARAYRKEVAKNIIIRAKREANRQPTMGTATNIADAERQERERQDFATSVGDTSYLTKRGLKKNIKQRSKLAVKRGKESV